MKARLNKQTTVFEHEYIMRVFELFSGTGSVGDVCKALGMDVVSLDRGMPAGGHSLGYHGLGLYGV